MFRVHCSVGTSAASAPSTRVRALGCGSRARRRRRSPFCAGCTGAPRPPHGTHRRKAREVPESHQTATTADRLPACRGCIALQVHSGQAQRVGAKGVPADGGAVPDRAGRRAAAAEVPPAPRLRLPQHRDAGGAAGAPPARGQHGGRALRLPEGGGGQGGAHLEQHISATPRPHLGRTSSRSSQVEHLERHGLLLRGMARHARLARLLRNASVGGFVYTRTQALQLRRKHNSSIRVLVRR